MGCARPSLLKSSRGKEGTRKEEGRSWRKEARAFLLLPLLRSEVERARRQRRRLSIQHLKTLEEAVVVYRRRCFFGIPMAPFTAGFFFKKSWKEEEEEERGKEQESNFLPGANGCK